VLGANGKLVRMALSSSSLRFLRQLAFGFLSVVIGFGMVVWVLYKTYLNQEPYYSGAFLIFGLGPLCIGYGGRQIYLAFQRVGPGESE